jgi:hypothetical protein
MALPYECSEPGLSIETGCEFPRKWVWFATAKARAVFQFAAKD